MTLFNEASDVHRILGGFFKELTLHPEIAGKLLDSKLKLRFVYKEPDTSIFIDLSGPEAEFFFGGDDKKADVEMTMKTEVAHRFWQGEVNLVMALARREVTAKGPIPKILKLLPIIRPAYALYPSYIEKLTRTPDTRGTPPQST